MRRQVLAIVSLLVSTALAAPSLPPNFGPRNDALINVVSSTTRSTVYVCPTDKSSSTAPSSSAILATTYQTAIAPPATLSTSPPVVGVPPISVPTMRSKDAASTLQIAVAPTATPSSSVPVVTTPPLPATTTSSSNLVVTANGAGYSGKIQKGVVYQGDNTLLKILNKTTEVEFIIDWSPVRPNVDIDVEFMPQLWQPPATGDVSLATFQGGIAKAAALGSKWLLSWGEQEKKDYTLMAQDFLSILQPEAEQLGIQVAAPSVLQNPMSHNKPWLTNFLNTCDAMGCKISALTAHYWAPTGDPTWFKDFQNYVNAIAEIRPNLPLFIDNLSMNGTAEQQLAFLQEVLPWATAHGNIARIGLIPGGSGQEAFDVDGNLNELGSYWFGS